jgi:hypothetical protein
LKRLYLKNLIQFSKTLKADPRHPLLSWGTQSGEVLVLALEQG